MYSAWNIFHTCWTCLGFAYLCYVAHFFTEVAFWFNKFAVFPGWSVPPQESYTCLVLIYLWLIKLHLITSSWHTLLKESLFDDLMSLRRPCLLMRLTSKYLECNWALAIFHLGRENNRFDKVTSAFFLLKIALRTPLVITNSTNKTCT